MTRAELLAIAARVEAAQGADRELDHDICVIALGWTPLDQHGVWLKRPDGSTCLGSARPRFTTSLDAALTLVPADWHVTVRGLNDSWHVELGTTWAPTAERPARTVTAFCGNEARATTAAAFRARAEEIRDE